MVRTRINLGRIQLGRRPSEIASRWAAGKIAVTFTTDSSSFERFARNSPQWEASVRRDMLGRWAYAVGVRAKKSMLSISGPSPPGRPPHAHVPAKEGLRDIRSADSADTGGNLVILVGPVDKSTSIDTGMTLFRTSRPVAALMEFGGEAAVPLMMAQATLHGRVKGAAMAVRYVMMRTNDGDHPIVWIDGQPYQIRRVRYSARPFMRPALEKELEQATEHLRDAVESTRPPT